MKRDELGELSAFLVVAEERSFTRAAIKLCTSQSSLSHTVRRLEERMGVRLLTRTTRNVAPTEAGEELVKTLRPAFNDIRKQLEAIHSLRDEPAGNIRLTSSRNPALNILMPAVTQIMTEYPAVKIEISIDHKLTDIVEGRFDAGVRLGERIEKDMIAVRIGPDLRMAVVGSPDYFKRHSKPETPHDLVQHSCINLRLQTSGGLYAWELEKDGQSLHVRVAGGFTVNDAPTAIQAALNGLGLACLPDDHVGTLIEQGHLIRVLEAWCPPFPGYHLYYPNRRQASLAFEFLVKKLRYHP